LGGFSENARRGGSGLNIFVVWDKIHRLIRDIKLASEHTAGSDLYRALLHTSFVFSLNQRPFGSGEWFEKKKEILAHFIDTHTPESDFFRRFAPLIAGDMGIPCNEDPRSEPHIGMLFLC
jgi:hypothetical protein